MHETAPNLNIIKYCVPDSRKDNSNKQEDKSRHKNIAITGLFGVAELTGPVVSVFLVSCSRG